jgi:TonB-linked SusC/RagA family outer membrane protein
MSVITHFPILAKFKKMASSPINAFFGGRFAFSASHVVCLLLLGYANLVSAQNFQVSGRVSDSNGNALPGVNVVVKNTTTGTTTDANGGYSLTAANQNATLTFSFIGFTTQDIAIGGRSTVNVTMSEDVTALSEVVVTALGIEREAKTLTYSAQQLSGKQLNEVRDANFVNTLSGKVAGLVVSSGSSGPGSATRVTLRGNRSIAGSNNALFVVDGVPIDNTIRGQVGSDFGGYNRSDGASNINPDDIESMTVLKGAAAAALYGSRAANGVIMVTTKKGASGKITTHVNSGVVVESPLILPSFQNEYGQGSGGVSSADGQSSWGGKTTTYPNNVRDFYRNALSTNNSIGVSGGTEHVRTYLSYTHNSNQGIIPNNRLQRHTVNLRINADITKKLSVDGKITYVNQDLKNRPYSGENNGIVMNLLKTPRNVDLNQYKTFEDENGFPTYWTSSGIYMNPYWTLNRTFDYEKRNRSTILGSAKYKITDWLNIQGRVSFDTFDDLMERGFSNRTVVHVTAAGGTYQNFVASTLERNLDLILSGNNNFGKDFALTYNFGAGQTYNKYQETGGLATGLSVTNKFDLNFATNLSRIAGFSEKELQYAFGTASLTFRDYLTVDASVRNDWSSTLPAPHSYLYSSFGANLLLSDAVQLPAWISFAKIRGSFAQVGNDTSPYSLLPYYVYNPGGSGGYISRNPQLPNSGLKPEISSSTELGLDLRLFGGRLGIDATYYNSLTENQILSLQLPNATGFNSQLINAGKIRNRGVEIMLSAQPLKEGALTWNTSVNFARNVNKVVELHNNIKEAWVATVVRTAGVAVHEGGAFGDLYGYTWAKNDNGQYIVNDTLGTPIRGSIQHLGNFNPKFTLGWNNSFSFKDFVLNFLIDGRVGGTMVSGSEANLAYDGNSDYTIDYRSGGWVLPAVGKDEGLANTIPITAQQFWQTVSQGRYSWGEPFTYSTTNFRLRELSLGYNIPLAGQRFFTNAKVSLTARNLFFLYRGYARMDIPGLPKRKMNFDPDVNLGAGNFQGIDYGNLPTTRTVGLNLQLSF